MTDPVPPPAPNEQAEWIKQAEQQKQDHRRRGFIDGYLNLAYASLVDGDLATAYAKGYGEGRNASISKGTK